MIIHQLFIILYSTYVLTGKGKKDDDWSDDHSDEELKEVSDEEIAKPVSKKKGEVPLTLILTSTHGFTHLKFGFLPILLQP